MDKSNLEKLFTKKIDLGSGQILTVKALSIADIFSIASGHLNELERIMNLLEKEANEAHLIMELIRLFPEVIFKVMACATGEDADLVEILPFNYQLEILHLTCELTFVGPDSLKKTWGLIQGMLPALKQKISPATGS